ncbi:DNA internalization-related competence protein ComEC/Rec2 [Pseudomonas sp. CFBP 8758]|uniref:DNA internalization-related competence protein ComEC/Rec2 n=1 Tax=Pseudomonas baltica TaxID=2762576 RepID=A0A7X1G4C9_9PSED|nr:MULTISPECIES: DNA internalization-related competence protein ComEC/Rec2 [Pseudomonas]MBC2678247.1 DNA internalization-related competence protein ComEC/Rec2 [Pseudomonas baltica]MBD8592894.1 DNA internalization-related competence protein ComEC/Rec2 [Pseudomonas sp. CFBP 8758]
MRTAMLALATGMVCLRWLPALPSLGWLVGMSAGGVLLLAVRRWHCGLFLLGLCWACLHAHWATNGQLVAALDGQTLWLEGEVVGLPATNGSTVRFELAEAWSRRAQLPSHLRLAWYGGPRVVSGERWRLAVKLKRPRALVNPGGFDAQAWALAKGIGATGSVKAGQRVRAARLAWRDGVRQRLLAVDSQQQGGTLAALLLGDGSGVSRQQWDVLQATGTVHLLVISGQHVGLLAGLLYGLVALLAKLGVWPARWPWLPCACAFAFTGALAYGLLAGFQVPVRRACIMIALVLLWRLRFRHLGVWSPLLLAFTTVLLVDPLVSLQPGFWLSFCAVGVLLLTFSGRLGGWRWWQAWTRAQCCVAVGLLPVMVALALPVSISGPLVNLLAVPWISLLVLPVAMAGAVLLPVPWVGETLLWLAGGALRGLFQWLTWAAEWGPSWLPPGLSPGVWLVLVIGVLLLLLPAGIPLRWLGVPMAGLLLFSPRQAPPVGQADIWVLDVGQGLGVLVRTAHHQLLYDTGPGLGEIDAGASVVVPSLVALGVRRLDAMIISHAHLDHSGGAGTVMRRLPVDQTLAGEPDLLPAAWQAQPCEPGRSWEWDKVKFVLWRWPSAVPGNPASCVLWVEANGERLLLSGDIDAAAEKALVASGLPVQAHWLQVPHHGSRTSSSKPLLDAVRPQAALISRGHGNTFGHPHASVLARFQALGIATHDTAEDGALRVRLGTFGPVQRQRSQRRFWREAPDHP